MNQLVLGLSRSAKRSSTWLMDPTVFLCLVGVVLPNAISVGAVLSGIGMPPRTAMIVMYATLAIIARVVSPVVTIVLYAGAVVYDVIATIALLFNLAPTDIARTIYLAADLQLFRSPLYIGLIGVLTSFVALNVALMTIKRGLLQRGSPLVLMGVAALFATGDFWINTSPNYHYGALYGLGKPMESAGTSSGFRQTILTDSKGRNVLLVVVEALGQFADPAQRALLMSPLANPDVIKRYEVTTGSTTYYGSTTAAEMRELCNVREPYQDLIDGKHIDCLPAQMAARGYHSVSLHGFTSQFFERSQWYPKLGFEQSKFLQDLPGPYKQCGGPFRGPCDVEMIPIIANDLRAATKPTFYYWLTLSTHVPIAPHEGTPRLACERGGGPFRQMEVCYMAELWMDVLDRIGKMTADLPPMDILIVGDHAPPLWSRAGRNLFEPGKVPWFRLTPRPDVAQAQMKTKPR